MSNIYIYNLKANYIYKALKIRRKENVKYLYIISTRDNETNPRALQFASK